MKVRQENYQYLRLISSVLSTCSTDRGTAMHWYM